MSSCFVANNLSSGKVFIAPVFIDCVVYIIFVGTQLTRIPILMTTTGRTSFSQITNTSSSKLNFVSIFILLLYYFSEFDYEILFVRLRTPFGLSCVYENFGDLELHAPRKVSFSGVSESENNCVEVGIFQIATHRADYLPHNDAIPVTGVSATEQPLSYT